MAERICQRQYIDGIIVYILNRQDGTNFADFLEGSHHVAYSKSKFDAPENGNRILTQKLHVQIANNPRLPQCQTETELLSSSRPP